jgi:integrase
MSILKMIFDFSIDPLKQRRDNPCANIKKPGIKKKKKKTWNEKEISNFLNLKDAKESSCYLAFLIIFSTGMRPGEVCGLRWCDWDEDCFTPTIGISKKREITDLKNNMAHNAVYIDQELIFCLKKTKIAQKGLYLQAGKEFTDECYINILMPDFRPMTPEYLTKTLKKICERNNIPPISIYSARHSLGTNMMRNGVNPKIVADILRHSTVRTTLDFYSFVDKDLYKNTLSSYSKKFIAK